MRQAEPAPAAPTGDAPELDDDDDDEVKSEDIQLILAMLQQLSEDTEDLHAKVDELQDAQEAEMSAQAVVSPAMPMSPGSDAGQPAPAAGGRSTVGGEACQFPAIYRGEPVSDCIDIAGKSSCKVTDGSWKPCAASAATAPVRPMTVDGEACILPAVSEIRTRRYSIAFPVRGRRTATDAPPSPPRQVYRGAVVTECIDVAGRSSCKVADGSWKPCAASGAAAPLPEAVPEPSSSEGPVTVDGEACILPTVSDETLRSCGCRTATDWRPPPPPRQVYRGEVVSECIDIAGRSSCKTAAGSWKECAAVWSVANAGGTAAPVPDPEPEPSPSQGPVTVDGEACILPTVSDETLRSCGRRTATDWRPRPPLARSTAARSSPSASTSRAAAPARPRPAAGRSVLRCGRSRLRKKRRPRPTSRSRAP